MTDNSDQEGVLYNLKQIDENKDCFDCGERPTTWASVSFGVFLCIKCAGIHRGFGADVSFVRSLTLDRWKDLQLQVMQIGGNQRALEFWSQNNLQSTLSLEKYNIEVARNYKELLKREASELLGITYEPPTPYQPRLTSDVPSKYQNVSAISSDEFFGNTPRSKPKSHDCCVCCTIL